MSLSTLGATLLGDTLAGTGIVRARYRFEGKRISRAGYGSKKKI